MHEFRGNRTASPGVDSSDGDRPAAYNAASFGPVILLRPVEQLFEEMPGGWSAQQTSRMLAAQNDDAIAFFTRTPGFELTEDSPSRTNDGRPKRWVVIRPPSAQTGILPARADGETRSRRSATSTLAESGSSCTSRTSTPATSA